MYILGNAQMCRIHSYEIDRMECITNSWDETHLMISTISNEYRVSPFALRDRPRSCHSTTIITFKLAESAKLIMNKILELMPSDDNDKWIQIPELCDDLIGIRHSEQDIDAIRSEMHDEFLEEFEEESEKEKEDAIQYNGTPLNQDVVQAILKDSEQYIK